MSTKTIDAKAVAKMFLAGAAQLNSKKDIINELNVFPVPDGDTGTNMTLTIMSAAKEVVALGDDFDMPTVCKAISQGSLRGARGNSGVILSQILRGLTKELREHETADALIIAAAFNKAVETAYKAVMKPKEGTILTVARGAAEKASELSDKAQDLEEFFAGIIEHADYVLSQTPELLPVLKQAGVVDSGGTGLVEVLKGANDALLGKSGEFRLGDVTSGSSSGNVQGINKDAVANAEIKFGYCTEFIIELNRVFNSKNEQDFKAYLESIGDSIVCVAMDDIVKVHVHTNHPGLAFERALTFGQLTAMKIDNMREEHNERLFKMEESSTGKESDSGMIKTGKDVSPEGVQKTAADEPAKKYGFITVSVGDGMDEIFRGLGADEIISGGQTMNPSTEDMLNAIEKVNAEIVFILPNNKNIILAANQAATLTEDRKVVVIPTKTAPQGITALINFMPDNSAEENEKNMSDSIQRVKTGEVTYAVRDTEIDNKKIKSGDIMGIGDHAILSVGQDIDKTASDMIGQLIGDDDELISIYYGADIDEEKAAAFEKLISEKYGDLDIEMHSGGQPIYYYIISVE